MPHTPCICVFICVRMAKSTFTFVFVLQLKNLQGGKTDTVNCLCVLQHHVLTARTSTYMHHILCWSVLHMCLKICRHGLCLGLACLLIPTCYLLQKRASIIPLAAGQSPVVKRDEQHLFLKFSALALPVNEPCELFFFIYDGRMSKVLRYDPCMRAVCMRHCMHVCVSLSTPEPTYSKRWRLLTAYIYMLGLCSKNSYHM